MDEKLSDHVKAIIPSESINYRSLRGRRFGFLLHNHKSLYLHLQLLLCLMQNTSANYKYCSYVTLFRFFSYEMLLLCISVFNMMSCYVLSLISILMTIITLKLGYRYDYSSVSFIEYLDGIESIVK